MQNKVMFLPPFDFEFNRRQPMMGKIDDTFSKTVGLTLEFSQISEGANDNVPSF